MARDISNMKFNKLYECYIQKVQKKGRTEEEALEVMTWLTGYKSKAIRTFADPDSACTIGEFYGKAPKMNPNRNLITGKICGVQVETIEDPFVKSYRQMDKLIDELAKGKSMETILRTPKNFGEYLLTVDETNRQTLTDVHALICEVLPDAVEKISYAMPTWWDHHNLIHMAAMKQHLGIYPGAEGVAFFARRLDAAGYSYSKGAIQFPFDQEIPMDLIREIASWCGEHNR